MKKCKHKNVAISGVVLCLLAVAIGAFGAHALKDTLQINQRIDVFDLANRYQFYHGLALLIVALLFQNSTQCLKSISMTMTAGIAIFSGSLYFLAITNIGWLGAITPVGGTLLLISWCLILRRLIRND